MSRNWVVGAICLYVGLIVVIVLALVLASFPPPSVY